MLECFVVSFLLPHPLSLHKLFLETLPGLQAPIADTVQWLFMTSSLLGLRTGCPHLLCSFISLLLLMFWFCCFSPDCPSSICFTMCWSSINIATSTRLFVCFFNIKCTKKVKLCNLKYMRVPHYFPTVCVCVHMFNPHWFILSLTF